MKREDIISMLGASWDDFGLLVRDALHSDIALLNSVNDSLLANSGKQLRPLLLLLVSKALGSINDDSLHFAASVELLHNATLLHDDVADGSSLRRGQATVAALMGPSAAVLVGDYWLSKAMDMVMSSKHRNDAVMLFSTVLSNLAQGEMLQIEKAAAADTSEEDYMRIIYCKTASLFEAACVAGALAIDAPQAAMDAAARYGRAVGLAFQIRDDMFDYTGGDGLGKPVGLDLKEKKITLPLLGALKNSGTEAEIRAMVRDIEDHPENCTEIQRFVIQGGGLDYASARLDEYILEARAALDVFPASEAKDILAELAGYNAIRKK